MHHHYWRRHVIGLIQMYQYSNFTHHGSIVLNTSTILFLYEDLSGVASQF
jgi:hypothetical protein